MRGRGIRKRLILVIGIEREHLLVDIGDEQGLPAVPVDVGGVHAHGRAGLSVFAEPDLGGQRDLLPLVLPAVYKQEVLHGVVGDEQVHQAIIVNVRRHYAKALAQGTLDIGAARDVAESSISVVVKQEAVGGFEDAGDAVIVPAQLVVPAGKLAGVIHKAADKQIQASVVVVIKPVVARGPSGHRQAGFVRYVGERSVAIVLIQNAAAVCGHEQVGVAVVIVIAHGHAHAERRARGHARLLGDIRKSSVTIVLVQRVA